MSTLLRATLDTITTLLARTITVDATTRRRGTVLATPAVITTAVTATARTRRATVAVTTEACTAIATDAAGTPGMDVDTDRRWAWISYRSA